MGMPADLRFRRYGDTIMYHSNHSLRQSRWKELALVDRQPKMLDYYEDELDDMMDYIHHDDYPTDDYEIVKSPSRTPTVIDTNVFLGRGDGVFKEIEDRDIIIPLVVILELEKKKTREDGLGFAARSVLRFIDRVKSDNQGMNITKDAIPCGNDNTLRVELNHTDQSKLDAELRDESSADRKILAVAANLHNGYSMGGGDVRIQLITNDTALRLLASCVPGIDPVPYEDQEDEIFDGRIVIDLDEDNPLYDNLRFGNIEEEELDDVINGMGYNRIPFHAIVEVKEGNLTSTYFKDGDSYVDLDATGCMGTVHIRNIRPRSIEQAVAMCYLDDPDIQMVSLGGVAGAGKSFMAISEGLEAVKRGEYDRVTVFRSMYAVGRQEQGFLKGDAEDKMRPWAQAVWDDVRKYDMLNGGKKARKSDADSKVVGDDGKTRTSLESRYGDIIGVEPITYLRGRTLENQFVIVDDAQSLDRSILLDVVSRLGEGSKIVFTFDMDQQDNPFLSRGTSIESLIQRLKDDQRFAHIDFRKSERSELAQLASQLLSEYNM